MFMRVLVVIRGVELSIFFFINGMSMFNFLVILLMILGLVFFILLRLEVRVFINFICI